MQDRNHLLLEYADNPIISYEFLSFLCGDMIGQGTYRDVFQYNIDPRYVVKVQRDFGDFSNIIEWEIWNNVKWTGYKKHFAPCHWISSLGGKILIQQKTQPITARRPAPQKIPAFFTDIKEGNFGWIGKQFVAHDYDYTFIRLIDGLNTREKTWKPHDQ